MLDPHQRRALRALFFIVPIGAFAFLMVARSEVLSTGRFEHPIAPLELDMEQRAISYFTAHGEPGAGMSLRRASRSGGELAICGKFMRGSHPDPQFDAGFIYSRTTKVAFALDDTAAPSTWAAHCAQSWRPGDGS